MRKSERRFSFKFKNFNSMFRIHTDNLHRIIHKNKISLVGNFFDIIIIQLID